VHAVVAGSTRPSQNVKKHTSSGPLLEVEMSKKCTPLWREAHFEVKSGKNEGFGALLDVRMSFAWQAQGILNLAKGEQNMKVL